MSTLLHLNNPGLKKIMRDNGLRKEDIVGRGAFSVVFNGRHENSVLKLTACDLSYSLMCDPLSAAYRHFALPTVIQDYGQVGLFFRNWRDEEQTPLYLYEIERLKRCEGKQKKVASYLSAVGNRHYLKPENCTAKTFLDSSLELNGSKFLSKEDSELYSDLFDKIGMFLMDWGMGEKSGYDLHGSNFMARDDGSVVVTDPILSTDLFFKLNA